MRGLEGSVEKKGANLGLEKPYFYRLVRCDKRDVENRVVKGPELEKQW